MHLPELFPGMATEHAAAFRVTRDSDLEFDDDEVEDLLKAGQIKALVATSSLELGIDMGAVDLVIQVESPASVASGLQRVGRAGHQVGAFHPNLEQPEVAEPGIGLGFGMPRDVPRQGKQRHAHRVVR